MEEIINIIKQIVTKFGRNIVVTKKFVNIFSDLYPSRHHPLANKVVREAVACGFTQKILTVDKVVIKKEIDALSKTLVTQGLQRASVENTLYAIVIGADLITVEDYRRMTANPKPEKQSKPQPHNPKPSSPKPSNPPQSSNPPSASSASDIKVWCGLLVVYVTAMLSPFIYAHVIKYVWPFWAYCGVSIINLSIWGFFGAFILSKSKRFAGGFFTGIAIFSAVLNALWPFIIMCGVVMGCSPTSLLIYYGVQINDEGDMWFTTPIFCVIWTYIIIMATSHDTYQYVSKQSKSNHHFAGGVLAAISICSLTIFGFITMPYYINLHKINEHNKNSNVLLSQRSEEIKNLSFCGLQLGSSYEKCKSLMEHNMEAADTIHFEVSGYNKYISTRNGDYTDLITRTLMAKTTWDNQDVGVVAFFNKDICIAIHVVEVGDPLPIFKKKYGQPEHFIPESICDYDNVLQSDISTYTSDTNLFSRGDYTWTYKNAIISISLSYGSQSIFYIDRRCEALMRDLQEKKREKAQKQARQKRLLQKREEERERRKMEIEQKQAEINHKRAVEEI